ncbi:MAG: hypothetical protein GY927_03415 [bacterium]|nr:hypothetical protein [bacterium]
MELKIKLNKLIHELISMPTTEKKQDKIFHQIDGLSPDPEWSDYIFHSEEFYNKANTLNVDAVVDKIVSYKPIQL